MFESQIYVDPTPVLQVLKTCKFFFPISKGSAFFFSFITPTLLISPHFALEVLQYLSNRFLVWSALCWDGQCSFCFLTGLSLMHHTDPGSFFIPLSIASGSYKVKFWGLGGYSTFFYILNNPERTQFRHQVPFCLQELQYFLHLELNPTYYRTWSGENNRKMAEIRAYKRTSKSKSFLLYICFLSFVVIKFPRGTCIIVSVFSGVTVHHWPGYSPAVAD